MQTAWCPAPLNEPQSSNLCLSHFPSPKHSARRHGEESLHSVSPSVLGSEHLSSVDHCPSFTFMGAASQSGADEMHE